MFVYRWWRAASTRFPMVSVASLLGPVLLAAQGVSSAGFTPGARTILNLDFAGTAIGDFPKGLRLLSGNLEVVDKDGMHMLRASSPSEFVIQLPEALPQKFSLEIDLISKACCNPVDLAVEGVISGSRSSVSAQLEWDPDHFAVVGGNPDMFQMDMPAAIAATLPGAPATVALSFDDETIRMYTNGTRVYSLTSRKFVRGRVLRVFLGGTDDDRHAVYLSRVRVADASTTVAASNATQSQGAPNASGSPGGPLPPGGPVPPSGPIPPSGSAPPNTSAPPRGPVASSGPTVTAPSGANAGTVPSGFAVTVTMGPSGPIVSWPAVPNATGYTVSRYKSDDLNCCNTSSGRTWGALSPWQDQPLPISGTYVYQVIANTAVGQMTAQTTFAYTQPAAPVTAVPAVTTGTATPMPAPTAVPATTTGTATPMPAPTAVPATTTGTATPMPAPTAVPAATSGTATPIPAPTSTVPDPANPSNPSGGSGAAATTTGTYRVTLTGFRAAKATLELPTALDGRGDEVYAAAMAVLWDRTSRTIRSRSSSRTKEHGDIGNGTFFSNRIQAGTMTPNGGIWTGNGMEQVPSAFDPGGSSIPVPTTDRFPLMVWEGTLSDGVDALLVVPTLWERDIDPTAYQYWLNNWTSLPLTAFLGSPQVQSQVIDPNLTWVTSSASPGLPVSIPLPDISANTRDHPIGMIPQPPVGPVTAVYQDRHVVLTREKLASLAPGSATLLMIPYSEPSTFLAGLYWLYVRVERVQ